MKRLTAPIQTCDINSMWDWLPMYKPVPNRPTAATLNSTVYKFMLDLDGLQLLQTVFVSLKISNNRKKFVILGKALFMALCH